MSVCRRGVHSKVADFIGLVNSEWYNQNKVGNIDIIVLGKVCEKLERTTVTFMTFFCQPKEKWSLIWVEL